MRALTVTFDRVYGTGAWILVESGLPVSRYRHEDLDEAVEEARRLAAFGHARGDPRDVRILTRDGPILVPAPELSTPRVELVRVRPPPQQHR